MGCCPTCGQDIPHLQVFIDLGSNRVTRFGREVKLRPQEAALLVALVRASPGMLSHDGMILAIWGDFDVPDAAYQALQLYIHRLRRKVAGLGLEIRTHIGEGYSLHSDPEHMRAAKRVAARRGIA
jgi:DNA-binding response OmpR family regulator